MISVISILFIITGCFCSKDAIPVHLEACYRGGVVPIPFTFQSLKDIIIKLENANPLLSSSDIATALLDRFAYDGIERSPLVSLSAIIGDNVVPYRTTGIQRVRSQLLRDHLLPPSRLPLAPHKLNLAEQCTLHFMLSSSVDPWERGDEYKVCPTLVSAHNSVDTETGARRSPCPIEYGVMLVGGQAVSPARVLAGILAVITPSDTIWNDRVLQAKWLTSISGDLAEVAAFQTGLTKTPVVGAAGKWNDTLMPTTFYIIPEHSNFTKDRLWQFTDAEILGDIDGLIIGNLLHRSGISSLRLSQLLELYYSDVGDEQGYLSAASRREFLSGIGSEKSDILTQAKIFVKMIQNAVPTIEFDVDKSDVFESAFNAFMARAGEINLDATFKKRKTSVKTSLNVIFDSSFPSFYTLKTIYALAEGIDVWHWGSRLSAINGETGAILIWDAPTLGDVWLGWLNATEAEKQPTKLSLSSALLGLKRLLTTRTVNTCWYDDEPPAHSHETVILDMANTLTDHEFSLASSVIDDIFIQHPEMNFTFITHNKINIDALIKEPYKDRVKLLNPEDFIERTLSLISTLDRVLRPEPCCGRRRDSDTELVEVGYPSEVYNFRIPDEFFCNSTVPTLNILNDVYGTLKVCKRYVNDEGERNCVTVSQTAREEVSLHRPPCLAPPCPGVHVSISVTATSRNCHEMLCQTSDGVKYTLHLTGMKCVLNLTTLCTSRASTNILPCASTSIISILFIVYMSWSLVWNTVI